MIGSADGKRFSVRQLELFFVQISHTKLSNQLHLGAPNTKTQARAWVLLYLVAPGGIRKTQAGDPLGRRVGVANTY